jgi:hypothetical protein
MWFVVSLVIALSGPASAKGAQGATITGPGIAGTLHMENVPEGPATTNVNRLAEATGADYAVFRSRPSPLKAQRPSRPLGPRYQVVYQLYVGENEVTPVRQTVYPFARAGFVAYTPPGQRAFHRAVRSGWYTSAVQPSPPGGGMPSETATALFVSAGVPDRRPSSLASPSDCSNMSHDATVRVPGVIGMTLPDAIRAVEAAGLNVIGSGTAPGDPTGDSAIVTAQEPDGIVPPGACIGFRTK